MSTPPISPAVQSILSFADGLIADPASLSREMATRLRRYLIRVANGSRKALHLADRFHRGEIDGEQLLAEGGG